MNIPLIKFSEIPSDIQEYIKSLKNIDVPAWLIWLDDNNGYWLNLYLFNPFPEEIYDETERPWLQKLADYCHRVYGLKPFYLIKDNE